MVEVLPADLRKRPLKHFQLIPEEKDSGGNDNGDEEIGVLFHDGFDSKHVIRLTSIHLADTLRTRILELRIH
jgi:hypothetical protein